MRRTLARSAGLFLTLACAAAGPAPRQTAESMPVRGELRFLQYLPPQYAADPTNAAGGGKGWPLVLFLHGSGQCGSDVQKVKDNGPPKRVGEGHDYPFVLISPQCDEDAYWNADQLAKLVDDTVKRLRLDPDRVYVTGLSMGGFGTWDLLRRHPDRFAAAVPVCGGGDPDRPGREVKTMPVWAFHGSVDDAVPVEKSQKMIDAYRRAGNPDAKLTIYPGVGHDSWTRAYDDPDLWAWLLSHTRKRATPTTQKS